MCVCMGKAASKEEPFPVSRSGFLACTCAAYALGKLGWEELCVGTSDMSGALKMVNVY